MLPDNVSPLEATWMVVAFLGAAVAVGLVGNIVPSQVAVERWIRDGQAVRWGPRHKFVTGFLVGAALFALIWVGFIALGVNAAFNPPPIGAVRQAASERGGWILVGLEIALLAVQGVLFAAWVAVGHSTVRQRAPRTLATLLLESIDYGREMGHTVANELQLVVSALEVVAEDQAVPAVRRAELDAAIERTAAVMTHVHALHVAVKTLEPKP